MVRRMKDAKDTIDAYIKSLEPYP